MNGINKVASHNGNGDVSFTFTAAEMNTWASGNYDITGLPATGTVGTDVDFTGTVAPDNATCKDITYAVKSGSATITNGKLSATSAGNVVVVATVASGNVDGSDYRHEFTVAFTEKPDTITVSKVKLNKTSITLAENRTSTLKATVTPDNAANKKVTWKSSDTKIAKVSSTGKVTAVKAGKAGKATITCTAADGSRKKASCKDR